LSVPYGKLDCVDDDEVRYRAVSARDGRFDGWFFVGVRTTGIYCRPSCPARTAKRDNCRFFPSAAAAQLAGFRACKRCRPDAVPGSPEWNVRADVAGRAMRLIADGLVDREGVTGLSRRLGYSERHVHRVLQAELGAGPLALARAQRAHTARLLLETTDLPAGDVAFAAGFGSIRQFDDTVHEVFAMSPTGVRARARGRHRPPRTADTISLRLPFREPFNCAHVFGFLAGRAVPGMEVGDKYGFRRALSLPHGVGVANLSADPRGDRGWVRCTLTLTDLRDLSAAVQRCRRLLDLDADPTAVTQVLQGSAVLRPLVAAVPGVRVPGTVAGDEPAVRAVLGQQVSVAGARTLAGRLVRRLGTPVQLGDAAITHTFPTVDALAGTGAEDFPMPASRRHAVQALATAIADGEVVLDAGADRPAVQSALLTLPGIGEWTASYIAMRALGDPDVFLATDLGVRRSLAAAGYAADPRSAAALAGEWRPWRSYAVQHLWVAGAALATDNALKEEIPA
jgi:AraC family transcriptional regulator, regulatory protein of adaptative response / DNA-3-methyladenine glycosylase II